MHYTRVEEQNLENKTEIWNKNVILIFVVQIFTWNFKNSLSSLTLLTARSFTRRIQRIRILSLHWKKRFLRKQIWTRLFKHIRSDFKINSRPEICPDIQSIQLDSKLFMRFLGPGRISGSSLMRARYRRKLCISRFCTGCARSKCAFIFLHHQKNKRILTLSTITGTFSWVT